MATQIRPGIKRRYPTRAELDPRDADALDRCIASAKKESKGRAQQIEDMLTDPRLGNTWYEVATFACYCCQMRTLKLAPHEFCPDGFPRGLDHLNDDDWGPQHPRRDDPRTLAAMTLAQRLLDANLSVFEPDPGRALKKAGAA